MSLPKIASREEWLKARKELLAKEMRLTRERDALNPERRNLPMVEVEKDYFLDLTSLGRQEDWEPAGRSESVRDATPDFAA